MLTPRPSGRHVGLEGSARHIETSSGDRRAGGQPALRGERNPPRADESPVLPSPRVSRRRLLTGAAALGGATAALPLNLRKALAAPSPRSFTPKEIKHVLMVMQENRRFDHYFGTMPGVRGFADTDHSWGTQHLAWDGGKMDQWLPAKGPYWEHPSDAPALGAQWLSAKIDAIASNRELWESTVFVLNYDENDGLFDHVVPPTPPAGTPDEFITRNSIYGGFVCSDISDHTSVLQFLEVVTGVPCSQISEWRRKTASDLTGAFAGPGYNPALPDLPDTNGAVWLSDYTTTLPPPSIPSTNQTFPYQPGGHRPHTR